MTGEQVGDFRERGLQVNRERGRGSNGKKEKKTVLPRVTSLIVFITLNGGTPCHISALTSIKSARPRQEISHSSKRHSL